MLSFYKNTIAINNYPTYDLFDIYFSFKSFIKYMKEEMVLELLI